MTKETFRTFEEIEHTPLRVFNRVVTAYNIQDDFGPVVLEEYYNNFDDLEKLQMASMMEYIKQHGREAAKKVALKGLKLQEQTIH